MGFLEEELDRFQLRRIQEEAFQESDCCGVILLVKVSWIRFKLLVSYTSYSSPPTKIIYYGSVGDLDPSRIASGYC